MAPVRAKVRGHLGGPLEVDVERLAGRDRLAAARTTITVRSSGFPSSGATKRRSSRSMGGAPSSPTSLTVVTSVQPQSRWSERGQRAGQTAGQSPLAQPRGRRVPERVVVEVIAQLGGGRRGDVAPREPLAPRDDAALRVEAGLDQVVRVARRERTRFARRDGRRRRSRRLRRRRRFGRRGLRTGGSRPLTVEGDAREGEHQQQGHERLQPAAHGTSVVDPTSSRP